MVSAVVMRASISDKRAKLSLLVFPAAFGFI